MSARPWPAGEPMYIESDKTFDPPLQDVNVRISTHRHDGDTTTPLEYEAFTRDRAAGTVRFKSYDAGGAVVWVTMRQTILEEAVFGEI